MFLKILNYYLFLQDSFNISFIDADNIYDRPHKGTQTLSVMLGISHPLMHQSSTIIAAIMSIMLAHQENPKMT
jgi:hypothetical protein